jgi:hypothetical protein
MPSSLEVAVQGKPQRLFTQRDCAARAQKPTFGPLTQGASPIREQANCLQTTFWRRYAVLAAGSGPHVAQRRPHIPLLTSADFEACCVDALFSAPFRLLAAVVRLCVAVPIVRYVCLAIALAGSAFIYSSYQAAHCRGDAYGFVTGRNLGIACGRTANSTTQRH